MTKLYQERGKIAAKRAPDGRTVCFMAAANPFVFGNFTSGMKAGCSANLNQVTVTIIL